MTTIYYETDIDPKLIQSKKVTVVGYGAQGHAHAQNLRDSGVTVNVVDLPGTPNYAKAVEDGFKPVTIEQGVAAGDVIVVLLPDEVAASVYRSGIAPNLKDGKMLMFAHGFNIHYGQIVPPSGIDVAMVAPKGPGNLVRSEYERGGGVPNLVAVYQNATGKALETALSYSWAIGGARAGVIETTFAEETETDLFGEQVVLCGGLTALIKAGFETLVAAGYQPEVAYYECMHEVKLIVDLLYKGGIAFMRDVVSNTAEYGDVTRGPRLVTDETRRVMREILDEVQSGAFAREWLLENQVGRPMFNALVNRDREHPIEVTGNALRKMMPWLKES